MRTRGRSYGDRIDLFTGSKLPKRLVTHEVNDRCKRIGSRRIDCEVHDEEEEESGVPCLNTIATLLFRSGLTFTRPCGPACHHKPLPFDRT
ncbi:MAG: hypothetical protein QOK30_2814, partial [Nocardioidaceae bacterium]|nr:hypothetical protein [Nocardioidaceae bacterium]